MADTEYAETSALVAVMDGDVEEADAILDRMLPHELRALARHARVLQDRIQLAQARD